ncbi:MAG: tetratricopeptide repeat protein, partial [Planctomycetia bacterium]|nr:tetratricopeptide repeat protein [Planctomycetia bacterium]
WLVAGGCAAGQVVMFRVHRHTSVDADIDFDEAVALTAELRYDEAAEKFSSLVKVFEASGRRSRAAEAMFWQAYCHEKRGDAARARKLYRLVVSRYAETAASRQASARLSRMGAEPK